MHAGPKAAERQWWGTPARGAGRGSLDEGWGENVDAVAEGRTTPTGTSMRMSMSVRQRFAEARRAILNLAVAEHLISSTAKDFVFIYVCTPMARLLGLNASCPIVRLAFRAQAL